MEYACRRAGCVDESRKFVPHVTLARLNRGSGNIADWLARHENLALGPWDTGGFALYESCLTPGGSVYAEIERFPPLAY